ncbi:MAG TPA: MBL fold metallo-hydrolase [Candidatus Limnocylindrales bacterium]|nr:MBL fold metallo-hydrolase [Candidatus Limnocylindrales bacterium]
MISHPILWDSGVYLPEQRLWLDPKLRRPRAVISHAHSDHVAAHPLAFMTPQTGRLVSHRRVTIDDLRTVPYETPLALDGTRLTFYSAGHVLGSAQTLLETDFGRVLYTGDLKVRPGYTTSPARPRPADVLILESTFGKPRYTFPDHAEVIAALVAWCRGVLNVGATPALLGYSLGKGQEVIAALSDAGFTLALHPALHAVTDVYRELGCTIAGGLGPDQPAAAGSVLLMPPSAGRAWALRADATVRFAALTGWAMDAGLKDRLQVDAAFPLSDHADFQELCQFAQAVAPQMTYTVLGFDEDLALALRRRGLRAAPLRQPQQLAMF